MHYPCPVQIQKDPKDPKLKFILTMKLLYIHIPLVDAAYRGFLSVAFCDLSQRNLIKSPEKGEFTFFGNKLLPVSHELPVGVSCDVPFLQTRFCSVVGVLLTQACCISSAGNCKPNSSLDFENIAQKFEKTLVSVVARAETCTDQRHYT